MTEEIKALIRAHIRSIMQLEVLLHLHRSPERGWTAEEINRELRSSLDATGEHLRALCASGLVQEEPGKPSRFRYAPSRAEDHECVVALAVLFKERFHMVAEIIYAPERKNVQAFADAFKIKKGGHDDG